MKVKVLPIEKKRIYQYKTVVVEGKEFKGWELNTRWGSRASIADVVVNGKSGKIEVTLKKLQPKGKGGDRK